MFTKVLLLAAAATAAVAQSAAYGQCGGQGFTGAKTCVSGYSCKYNSQYYSQCMPGSSGASPVTTVKASTTAKATPTTAKAAAASTQASSGGSGTTYKASFTEYGAGDTFGSPNCQTSTSACGFYTSPGYAAAVSQNEFGVGPGAGAGPACGTCWKLTIQTDSSGNKVKNAGNSIVVQVNNLCPASGNPLCSQNGLTGTNSVGANLNFDTCIDSGASAALFGNSGVGLGLGTAVQVSCNQWSGTVVH